MTNHRLLAALIILIFSSSCFADEWTQGDTSRETTYLVIHTIDWMQTRNIARKSEIYYETNKFLRTRQSTIAEVNTYFLLTGLAHVAIANWLSEENRKAFQHLTIGMEGGYVLHNFSIGVSAEFN